MKPLKFFLPFVLLLNYSCAQNSFTSNGNTHFGAVGQNNSQFEDHFSTNTSNAAVKYVFGIPPIPIDPIIPGVRDDDDFENWVPPLSFRRMFPGTLSGFDAGGHPIWITQLAKSDLRKIVLKNATRAIFEKQMRQYAYLAIKSQEIRSTKEKPIKRHIFIIDYEGLQPDQVANPNVLWYTIRLMRKNRYFYEKYIERMYLINVNFVVEILLNLVRTSILGRLLNRLETYGTDKVTWIKQLRKRIPIDQLPEKYGGLKGHMPIPIYLN